MKIQIESRTQQACVRWFRYQYPNIIISSFPNQGIRSKANASRMVAEGLTKGMTDIIILKTSFLERYYGALLIEFKSEKGKLTKEQKEIHDKLTIDGYMVAVIRNFDEFKDIIEKYFANSILC